MKTINPFINTGFWTRLEVTLTEASNLIDELCKKSEKENEQHCPKALDKHHIS